jgi:hypothetical protein
LPVHEKDADEVLDAIRRIASLGLPLLQHLPGIRQPQADDRIQNLVLGLEVIVEIPARNLHGLGNVREGRMLVALLVKQLIGDFDDVIAGGGAAHGTLPLQYIGRAP